jgi:hypothetical protein
VKSVIAGRMKLIQFYRPSSLHLSPLLHLCGQAITTATLSNEECVSMHYYEYCDGNDELFSGVIKGEFRAILYQIGNISAKCARILQEVVIYPKRGVNDHYNATQIWTT